MKFLFGIFGILLSLAMFKYRERVGELIGDAPWMQKLGGVYGVVMLTALFFFFWSIAAMVGSEHLFFAPLRLILGPFLGR